jgi:hypothetical protein
MIRCDLKGTWKEKKKKKKTSLPPSKVEIEVPEIVHANNDAAALFRFSSNSFLIHPLPHLAVRKKRKDKPMRFPRSSRFREAGRNGAYIMVEEV